MSRSKIYSNKFHLQSESTAEEYRQTFEMDNKTGRVFLKKALDYETNSYYQFNVTARVSLLSLFESLFL